jgi:hypothetical protein
MDADGAAGPGRATGGPARLWTAAEANARLPALRELIPRLRGWASRLSDVHAELGRLARFWGDELGAHDHPDHGLKERLEAEWRNLTRRLDEAVESMRAEAIELKQLETGLVDFYALVDGELVFLCWRTDEAEVGHFHPLEGGYATRRPLPNRPRTLSTGARGPA